MIYSNQLILDKISCLASDCFGDNLKLSFIGGSHAKGKAKSCSDIDTFIVLREPDRIQETEYYHRFRQYHLSYGLEFSHCGQVFDQVTLGHLMSYVFTVRKVMNETRGLTGCYTDDCCFSVFRKGAVIMGFLKDEKTFIKGDTDYLNKLEIMALKFVEDFPLLYTKAGQPDDVKLAVIADGHQALEVADLENTPVGIGLERWFRRPFGQFLGSQAWAQEKFALSMLNVNTEQSRCPIQAGTKAVANHSMFKTQCLAMLP